MRILYIDIDTLRPDHLGCYGYGRDTSPNIDRIAEKGVMFTGCYASDAPCLPSRAAMFSGRFGIHNGVVGHGGTAADPYIVGPNRGFRHAREYLGFVELLKAAGYYTVTASPFAERHSAWWFYEGFREMFNPGKGGMEIASEVYPYAEEWLKKNAGKDNWFLHFHVWDPHGPYRTPRDERVDLGPAAPQAKWLTEGLLKKHLEGFGPHSARETVGIGTEEEVGWFAKNYPETPVTIDTLNKFHGFIDGYDQGTRYADAYIGKLFKLLENSGVLEDTAVIITSDHGENIGELNVYGDHQTADYPTSRVPFILKWPGLSPGSVNNSLYYQADLAATILGFLGIDAPKRWDGKNFAAEIKQGDPKGRDCLVVSNCAWSCQRSVVSGNWLMAKTFHEGLKDFPEIMLFNTGDDPHEINNLAEGNPGMVRECLKILGSWHDEMMGTSETGIDPMDTVLKEGGPWHTRNDAGKYARRLKETGREKHAQKVLKWLEQGRYWK